MRCCHPLSDENRVIVYLLTPLDPTAFSSGSAVAVSNQTIYILQCGISSYEYWCIIPPGKDILIVVVPLRDGQRLILHPGQRNLGNGIIIGDIPLQHRSCTEEIGMQVNKIKIGNGH